MDYFFDFSWIDILYYVGGLDTFEIERSVLVFDNFGTILLFEVAFEDLETYEDFKGFVVIILDFSFNYSSF